MALAFSGGSLSRRLLREPARPSARPRVAPGDMGTLEVTSEPNLPLHRNRPTILTAMFGGTDVIRPQVTQDIDVDWICVTDDPELPVPAPFRRVVVRPETVFDHGQGSWYDPALSAKRFKLMPWTIVDADYVLWIDANMEVTSPGFAREALACPRNGIALFLHPRRRCIYDESEVSLGTPWRPGRYRGLPIREQVAHYRADGHPEQGGLYASGVIAWDLTDPRARALGEEWMTEVERWTVQCQLSLPVVLRRLGIEPGTFPGPQAESQYSGPGYRGNRWLRIWPHLPSSAHHSGAISHRFRRACGRLARWGSSRPRLRVGADPPRLRGTSHDRNPPWKD